MVLVFSSEPTKTTNISHRVTHALFEWIDKKSIQTGELVFPDVLLGLNHQGLEVTLKQSKRLKLSQDTAPINNNKKIETINYDNGKYIGELKDGKRHGQGTYIWADGNRYEGEWKNNLKEGHGTETWANGNRYEGDYKNGKMEGHGTYTWADGNRYEGDWKNDKKDGYGTFTWADGT